MIMSIKKPNTMVFGFFDWVEMFVCGGVGIERGVVCGVGVIFGALL